MARVSVNEDYLPEGVSEGQVAPALEGGYRGGLKALKQLVDG